MEARDIAAVAVKTLTEGGHEGRAYALTGSEALTYTVVAAILTDVLGRPIRYANPWIPEFVFRMLAQGHPLPFVLVMVAIYTTAKLGLAATVTDETARLLGRPPIRFRQFAEAHADSWRSV